MTWRLVHIEGLVTDIYRLVAHLMQGDPPLSSYGQVLDGPSTLEEPYVGTTHRRGYAVFQGKRGRIVRIGTGRPGRDFAFSTSRKGT